MRGGAVGGVWCHRFLAQAGFGELDHVRVADGEGVVDERFFFNTESIIMEAARRIDEWSYIAERIPGGLEVYRRTSRGKAPAEFKGRYELLAAGTLDGKPWTLALPAGAQPISLRQYARVEGRLDHPEAATVLIVGDPHPENLGTMFAGSLPRGVAPSIYAELIRELRAMNVTTIVDAEGEPMRLAVRAEPTVISPNVLEAEELVGHEFHDEQDRVVAIGELCDLGAREAIVTLPDGCVANVRGESGPERHRVWITPREAVATVGAGDAFLAGYVASRYTGQSPMECLRYGVACGAESTQRLGAGLLDPKGVDRVLADADLAAVILIVVDERHPALVIVAPGDFLLGSPIKPVGAMRVSVRRKVLP